MNPTARCANDVSSLAMKVAVAIMLVTLLATVTPTIPVPIAEAFAPSTSTITSSSPLRISTPGMMTGVAGMSIHNRHFMPPSSFPLYQSTSSSSSSSSSSLSKDVSREESTLTITPEIQNLLSRILLQTRNESDGTKLLSSQREEILSTVDELEKIVSEQQRDNDNDTATSADVTVTVPLPFTSASLTGEHCLIYTDTERTPQYIGPIKGATTQYFYDNSDTDADGDAGVLFQNRLTLLNPNLLQIALTAKCNVMDENRIKVKFQKFEVKALGVSVVQNEITNQSGVWKMVFVGEINVHSYGKAKDGGGSGYGDVVGKEMGNQNEDMSAARKRILLRIMRTPNLYILAKEL